MLLENFLLLGFQIVLWVVMSSSFFRWRKERERMETVAVLLMFKGSFVEGLQFSRWARQGTSVFMTRPGCEEGQIRLLILLGLHI